jgi:hypothetical protein
MAEIYHHSASTAGRATITGEGNPVLLRASRHAASEARACANPGPGVTDLFDLNA